MAADSDGEPKKGHLTQPVRTTGKLVGSQRERLGNRKEEIDLIETVFTCHGNLDDPDFPQRFSNLLDNLSTIISTEKDVLMKRVKKVEPWNSVRVTLTIPREAASRLRSLAAAGDQALQALGILSVQLEGDQVISLRLAARFGGEPQEIVLRTNNAPAVEPATVAAVSTAPAATSTVSALLNSVASSSGGFRSPNVVAPATNPVILPSPRPTSGPSPFPFASMTHAAQTQQARQESPHHNFTAPTPYAAKPFVAPSPRVTTQSPSPVTTTSLPVTTTTSANKVALSTDAGVSMSSPLLVNLLQTEKEELRPRAPAVSRPRRPPPSRFPPPVHRFPVTPPSVPSAATSSPALRPTFVSPPSVKDTTTSRSVIQGYSQFTALSSKPCSSSETADKSEEKNSTADEKKLIINPLTGELEPMPSESDSEEESQVDPFLYSSASPPSSRVFLDDEGSGSRRNETSDQSDSEATNKSNGSDAVLKRRIGGHKASHVPEKIKLRFMVDKPDPNQTVSAPASAYKVDLSFSPSVRKNVAPGYRVAAASSPPSVSTVTTVPSVSPVSSGEEPRVPPLHISLRGRNATVVSNKKKTNSWLEEEDLYNKLTKKKPKLGSGSVRDGRDSVAITNCDLLQKPKRAKMKRFLGLADGEGLKLKIPVTPDMDVTELCDEKLSKKRKDSKKLKNNLRHSESDADLKTCLKMDSEEWISRTLKEETLRKSVSIDGEVSASDSAVSENKEREEPEPPTESRTCVFKPANYELSELLRCKNVENSSKKLDTLKIKNKLLDLPYEGPEPEGEVSAVKKPQEIGGKIKSELSTKIVRVSGKLKNDLSKDGVNKKKLDESGGKAIKGTGRNKVVKKEGSALRLGSVGGGDSLAEPDDSVAFNRAAKRRHSDDHTLPECQAQKVKMRSASTDQPILGVKLPALSRRFDVLSKKIRKDSLIERLRKNTVGKVVPLIASDLHNKKVAVLSSSNGEEKPVEKSEATGVTEVKPALTRLETDTEKLKEGASGVEGNTQGEDSGIESMDALSEKSPNQSESPCRKEEGGKEMEDGKKGQNHDRTEEDDGKEMPDNSCLTMGNSNQDTQPPQATTVPFQRSSQNNNSNEPERDSSTKLKKPSDDSIIESFETKIREAFRREEDPSREGLAAKILEGSSKDWGKTEPNVESQSETTQEAEGMKDWCKEASSPSLEDMERFRVKPPLYTYAKREDSLSPSPTTVPDCDQRDTLNDEDEDSSKKSEQNIDGNKTSPSTVDCNSLAERNHVNVDDGDSNGRKHDDAAEENASHEGAPGARCLRNKSSLLEQLLIVIPPEDTRKTRSWNKVGSSPGVTPKSSPRPGSPSVAKPSPRTGSKASPTPRGAKRPSKRKSSENAAELIKACMGVDESRAGIGKTTWKKGDMESSDDEPLSDLARSREQSVEQDVKPTVVKPKLKQITIDEESRNNNKVAVKVVADTPTRRSVRQTAGGGHAKTVRAVPDRTVRSTRSALTQDGSDVGSKRRRSSRDGK